MMALLTAVRTFLSGNAILFYVAAAIVGYVVVDKFVQRKIGGDKREAEIVARSNKQAEERDKKIKADRARRPVNGAWNRLRKVYGISHSNR